MCNDILSSPGISWSGLVFGSAGLTCSFVGTNTLTYDVLVEFNTQTDLGAQTIERLVTHNVAILFSLDFLNENAVPEVVPVSKLMPPPPPPPLPTVDEDEKEDGGSGAPSVEPGPSSQPPPSSVGDSPPQPLPPSQCGELHVSTPSPTCPVHDPLSPIRHMQHTITITITITIANTITINPKPIPKHVLYVPRCY